MVARKRSQGQLYLVVYRWLARGSRNYGAGGVMTGLSRAEAKKHADEFRHAGYSVQVAKDTGKYER